MTTITDQDVIATLERIKELLLWEERDNDIRPMCIQKAIDTYRETHMPAEGNAK